MQLWALVQNRNFGFYKLKKQQISTSQGSLALLFWMFRSVPCHPTRVTLNGIGLISKK